MSGALSVQVGGDHYKTMPIQPVEFALVNGLNTCQANIIKYVCRHGQKHGAADLKKAIHYCDLWLELARDCALAWSDWALHPRAGYSPIGEFIEANGLPEAVGSVVVHVCWLPTPARVKTARAGLVALLFDHYGEVA